MNTLHVNLKLLNYPNEVFSLDKNNIINDDFISLETLSNADKIVYQNFINLVGFNNVILNDVELNDQFVIFNRIKLFDHDENYNILNHGSYLKSYNDYSEEDKNIIDLFLILLAKY